MPHKRKRLYVDSKKFVESYMNNDFNWQVAEEFGITPQAVGQKAMNLRRNGVNLPPRFERDDVEELNQIIAEIENRR